MNANGGTTIRCTDRHRILADAIDDLMRRLGHTPATVLDRTWWTRQAAWLRAQAEDDLHVHAATRRGTP